MAEYEFHEIAGIFPLIAGDDFSGLVADIAANGVREPIWLYEGKILDGRNRYKAAKEAGVVCATRVFNGTALEAIAHVWSLNRTRRHLNSSQAAMADAKRNKMTDAYAPVREAAKERQREYYGNQYDKSESGHVEQTPQVQDNKPADRPKEKPAPKTRDTRAKAAGTNAKYIDLADKLLDQHPEMVADIEAGTKTLSEIAKQARKDQHKADIQRQREAIEGGDAKLPDGVFEVVAMDPPWNYGREYDPAGSRVANPYPEMTQDELLAMQPPFAGDCALFLWTTHQFIWDAMALLDHWNFTYKATLVWDKEKIGMGSWLRMQCEFCLVGIRGKPVWENTSWRDIIREPRREHSRKPEVFYRMVEDITVGRRLDFFSRGDRVGWEAFGNDTGKF